MSETFLSGAFLLTTAIRIGGPVKWHLSRNAQYLQHTDTVTTVYLRQAPHYLPRAEPRSAKYCGSARAGVQPCVTAAVSAGIVVMDAEMVWGSWRREASLQHSFLCLSCVCYPIVSRGTHRSRHQAGTSSSALIFITIFAAQRTQREPNLLNCLMQQFNWSAGTRNKTRMKLDFS